MDLFYLYREEIDEIYFSHRGDLDTMGIKMSRYGVEPLMAHDEIAEGEYDCQDYVFDELGFPQYTYRIARGISARLMTGGLPDIDQVESPVEGGIVTYLRKKKKG